MAAEKLTNLQQLFLKALFGTAQGNIPSACKIIGIEDHSSILTDDLVEAIREKADQHLALSVPRATYVIQKMLDTEDGSMFFSEKLHKVATDVLDRAGLSKKERPSTTGLSIGLVFLPNKIPVELPPADEIITIEHKIPEGIIQDGL